MKIGIYISGLGENFLGESVVSYSRRLVNELSHFTEGVEYRLESHFISYSQNRESSVVKIFSRTDGADELIYKIYGFKYQEILTERFIKKSLLIQTFWLSLLILRKLPLFFWRIIKPRNYSHVIQSLYVMGFFFLFSTAMLFSWPAIMAILLDFLDQNFIKESVVIEFLPKWLNKEWLEAIAVISVGLTTGFLYLFPKAQGAVSRLSTEFVCANDYMEHGAQTQVIQGNLDLLIEYITEKEEDPEIHFHTYSFGTIVAFDLLFPFGETTHNVKRFSRVLFTIGTPLEFIQAYYPLYFMERNLELENHLHWVNIYSKVDALATNFRNDDKVGPAQFGITRKSEPPVNLNYDIFHLKKLGIIDFFMMYGIKAHSMYWDRKSEGQSCLRLIVKEMISKNLISGNR